MKLGIISILYLIVGTFISPNEDRDYLIHRFIVLPDSKLVINGKTNINSFRCGIDQYVGRDTLVLQEGGVLKKHIFLKGSVYLHAANFDCGMDMMTKDMMTTIKAKDYPQIVITFLSFKRLPNYKVREDKFEGMMTISLGGITKEFEVNCMIQPKPSGLIHLSGGRQFLFSDFNLEPPDKMMGMIKIQQQINVSFNLVLRLDTDA
jgi:hypothetical protein